MVRQERLAAANGSSDLAKAETLLKAYIADFPPQTAEEKNAVADAQGNICAKIADSHEWEKFKTAAAALPVDQRVSVYNNFAWELAEKGEDIEVLELPLERAVGMMASGDICDAKTIMLLQYAQLHLFR